MEQYILPFIVSVMISLVMTPIIRKFAIKIGAVDIPKDDRRMHKTAMPLMGGLAIYISVMAGMFLFMDLSKSVVAIMIGATIILISGIIDDLRELSPKLKLFFQIMAGVVLIIGGVKVNFITNPFSDQSIMMSLSWLSIPITLFWVVGITNTLNLIDGLDGLSAGVAMISSFSFMLVANKFDNIPMAILSSAVSGACLGFLPYNFNPARIFMGDTGALFLGFMLAAISIEGVMKSVATIAIVVPIMILGVPIFDTAFAILRRLISGKSIMSADKGHLHHRLLKKGFDQKETVLILYLISAIFGAIAVLMSKINSVRSVYMSIILFIIAVIIAVKLGFFVNKEDEKGE